MTGAGFGAQADGAMSLVGARFWARIRTDGPSEPP